MTLRRTEYRLRVANGGREDREMVETHATRWSGIHVVTEDGQYWIMDDNGGEEHVGVSFPSDEQLDAYREAAIT